MAIYDTRLTKGQARKLNALRKSIGDDLAEEVFTKWAGARHGLTSKRHPDPVAMKIVEALTEFEADPKFNLGNYGYNTAPRQRQGCVGLHRIQEGRGR